MTKENERDERTPADTWNGRDAEFDTMVDGWCREREVAEGRRSIGTHGKAREGAESYCQATIEEDAT